MSAPALLPGRICTATGLTPRPRLHRDLRRYYMRRLFIHEKQLNSETERIDKLLLQCIPKSVIAELRAVRSVGPTRSACAGCCKG